MILSQTSEYAIRAMAGIALHPDAEPVRAQDLSHTVSIPLHYLSKVLRKLVTAKLLQATKGHRGGFVLARPATDIKIVDVLEAVEVSMPVKHCIFGWRMCNSKAPCVLHHGWSAVNDAFQLWSRTTSLADIKNGAQGTDWIATALEQSKGPPQGSSIKPMRKAKRAGARPRSAKRRST